MAEARQPRHANLSELTRREFLAAGSLGLAGTLWADDFGAAAAPPRHVFRVRRDCDLLDLEIEFVNFREVRGQCLRSAPAGRSLVIVHFPPQNLAEAVFSEERKDGYELKPLSPVGPNANSATPPVRSYMSGPSRLVFLVPEGVELPLTRGGGDSAVDVWLQMLSQWPLGIPHEFERQPTAGPAPAGAVNARPMDVRYTPRPPRWDETWLELPYRLIIAPSSRHTRWLCSSERLPMAGPPPPGSSELWNAQLISRVKLEPARPPADVASTLGLDPNLAPLQDVSVQAKALYSPDYRASGQPGLKEFFPGRQELSLHSLTRHRLVKQMSQGNGWIDIDHLVLTALGSDAFLAYFNQKSFAQIIQEQLNSRDNVLTLQDLKKQDDSKYDTDLIVWKHRMVVGRDVYFVEAFFGVLFPMVYPSLYVELTQRKFASRQIGEPDAIGPPGAYLLKRRYIVVRQPERSFTGSDTALGRSMPVKSAVLGLTKSPDLLDPTLLNLADDLNPVSKLEDFGLPTSPDARGLLFVPRALTEVPLGGGKNPKALEWPITFTDESGRVVRTPHATLLFASNVILGQRAWTQLKPTLRGWAVPPQPMALAPEEAALQIRTDSGVQRIPIPVPEREGVARLGEALQTWHQLIRARLGTAEADFDRKLAEVVKNLPIQEVQDRLAALTAIVQSLPGVWQGTDEQLQNLYKSFLENDLHLKTVAELHRLVQNAADKIRGNVADTMKQMADLEKRASQALQALTAGTLNQIQDKLTSLSASAGSARESVESFFSGFHDQMRAVEKISSILEAQRITFGSVISDAYFKEYVDKLNAAGIKTAQDLDRKVDELLKSWQPRRELDSLAKLVDQNRKALLNAKGQADRLVGDYLAKLQTAKEKAKQLGAQQFHAVMDQVVGIVPSMKSMLPDYKPQTFLHLPEYVARGIHEVENGIFAHVAEAEAQLNSATDKALTAIKNGLGTPRTLIQGLSNRLGAVAAENLKQLKDLADPITKTIDDYKKAIPNSKLFGAIDLRDLVGTLAKGQVPSINLVKTPEKLSHTWKWTLPIDDGEGAGKSFFGILTYRNSTAPVPLRVCLNINIVTTTNLPKPEQALHGARPTGSVRLDAYLGLWDTRADVASPPSEGTDEKNASFSLSLLGMINIYFRQVRIEADYLVGATPKPRVKPDIVKVGFQGPLEFVTKLQSFLGNLGGGFRLGLSPKFIELSYGFLLPPISFGVFSLRNMLLQAGLMLPFGDDPLRFSFGISSFAVPFELTVMCFGGRGFLRVEIDTSGGRTLEGALEFGGSLAFDVVVASGALYVQAGVYFKITQSQTTLSGYLRAGGNLSVLGLIHVNVEFMLAISYRSSNTETELYGTATLTISIELLFFSISVNVSLEMRIAGSKKEGTAQSSISGPMAGAVPTPAALLPLAAVLLEAPAPANESAPPAAHNRTYFERHDFRPAEEVLLGRFPWDDRHPHQSARRWVEEYWSQFDLLPSR